VFALRHVSRVVGQLYKDIREVINSVFNTSEEMEE